MKRIYEPEDFLDTLDRMIDLSLNLLEDADTLEGDVAEEITEDLYRLRDLHQRIRLQFGMETVTWN